MTCFLARFKQAEAGAVSVDFVVITAAILAIGLIVAPIINRATSGEAEKIEEYLSEIDPGAED